MKTEYTYTVVQEVSWTGRNMYSPYETEMIEVLTTDSLETAYLSILGCVEVDKLAGYDFTLHPMPSLRNVQARKFAYGWAHIIVGTSQVVVEYSIRRDKAE